MERLLPSAIEGDTVERFVALAREIEARVSTGGDVAGLMEEWNAGAHRAYEAVELATYDGSMDARTFVREALLRPVGRLEDLRFEEASAAMGAVARAELDPAVTSAVMQTLEANFPGAEVSDLIFWPDAWFQDDARLHVALTPDQLVGYACARSGRSLEGAPEDLSLPHPVPARRVSRL